MYYTCFSFIFFKLNFHLEYPFKDNHFIVTTVHPMPIPHIYIPNFLHSLNLLGTNEFTILLLANLNRCRDT